MVEADPVTQRHLGSLLHGATSRCSPGRWTSRWRHWRTTTSCSASSTLASTGSTAPSSCGESGSREAIPGPIILLAVPAAPVRFQRAGLGLTAGGRGTCGGGAVAEGVDVDYPLCLRLQRGWPRAPLVGAGDVTAGRMRACSRVTRLAIVSEPALAGRIVA